MKGDRILGSSTSIYRAQARVGHLMCVRPWFSRSLLGKGQHVLKSTLFSALVTPHRLLFVKSSSHQDGPYLGQGLDRLLSCSVPGLRGPASGGGRRTWSKL